MPRATIIERIYDTLASLGQPDSTTPPQYTIDGVESTIGKYIAEQTATAILGSSTSEITVEHIAAQVRQRPSLATIALSGSA